MKLNLIIKSSILFSMASVLFTGCIATDPCFNNPNCMTNAEKEAYFEKMRQKEKDEAKSMSMTVEQYREHKNQKAREAQLKEEQVKLEHFASYEKNYLSEYEIIKQNLPQFKEYYFQPINKKEPCKVFMAYDSQKDESSKLYWDGECKDGYADGLGRLIQKADLSDRWQVGIYKKGKTNGYCVLNDPLHGYLMEGECKYDGTRNYIVERRIREKNNDIEVVYTSGLMGRNEFPNLFLESSPFWNNSLVYQKTYPNFDYVYLNYENNDESKLDFEFFLTDKKNKNGWAFGKPRNQNVVSGEYIMNKFNKVDLPTTYNNKADEIIKEISEAEQKAYQAQEQAQLVKKQYLKRICKDSVKVTFMDNDDYKLICNNYQIEKELFTKINDKLERLTKEKIARLEQQKFEQQQAKEEQYRQQQLAIERQRLAAQQAQARAAQDAADAASWANVQNSINNLNQQLQNNRPKFYNVTPTFGGGYNIMGF